MPSAISISMSRRPLTYLGRVVGQNPDDLSVRRLEESDIESLIDCVRRCYGESYPEADFYDATSIQLQLNEDRLISGVAVTKSGRVIGHIGTRISIPGDTVGESMGAFIDPGYRGLGLLRRIGHVIKDGRSASNEPDAQAQCPKSDGTRSLCAAPRVDRTLGGQAFRPQAPSRGPTLAMKSDRWRRGREPLHLARPTGQALGRFHLNRIQTPGTQDRAGSRQSPHPNR